MRPPQLNLSQLITFYFVARCKSFTVAAENLCISQPAVSAQLKALETQFGVKLIRVRRKRVFLTEEGEALLPHAEAIYRSSMRAERGLQQEGASRRLRIGVATALTLDVVPVLDRFREQHPAVRVTVREGSSLRLIGELLEGRHDLCVVGAVDEDHPALRARHLRQSEQMVLVAAPESPLARRDGLGWEDLDGCPLVLHCEGSMARRRVLAELARRGIEPNVATEIDSVEGMKRLIRQGKGVGLMFLPNVREDVDRGSLTVLPLDLGRVQVGIDLLARREDPMPPTHRAFVTLMVEHFGELGPQARRPPP